MVIIQMSPLEQKEPKTTYLEIMEMLKGDSAAFDLLMLCHHIFYLSHSRSQQRRLLGIVTECVYIHVSRFKKIIQLY